MKRIKKFKMRIFLIIFAILFQGCMMINANVPSVKYFFDDDRILKLINYIKSNNEDKIKQLIEDGVNISYIGKDGISLVYYFCMKQDFNIFKKLLELGADPNVYPPKMPSLIDLTMRYKDEKYFKVLLEYNVDVNYRPEKDDPLLKSALYSTVDIKYLKMLVEHGIKPIYSEYWTNNPLLFSLGNREYKKVILLLDYYPDYLKDERKIKLYKGESTIKEIFIEDLESYTQIIGSQLYKDQLELVKYLKDKFNVDVKLKYPNGR